MQVNPDIFKAYDVRGVYPSDLDEKAAFNIGRSFVTLLSAEQVVVGRDMRLSGGVLVDALIKGLTVQGADVIDIGMVSTDQFYFACARLGLPGVMVTASHNPKKYNGFKLVRKMPFLLSGDEGIQDIRRLVETEDFPASIKTGTSRRVDLEPEFIAKVLSLIDTQEIRPLKIVVDTANGMVGPIIQSICQHLPIKLIGMYLDPDGNLPNHGLDPLQPENRRELQQRVISEQADLGFAFDGDGDRFFAIDDRGVFVPGDFLTAILASYLLKKENGAKVIYDLRASWSVPDSIRSSGGIPLIERVGHAFIKERMAREGALFAGEVTGHYYFRDFFCADSGILPALFLLELLSKDNSSLSGLIAPLESKYFLSGEINTTVEDPKKCLQVLSENFSNAEQGRLDGLSVAYPDWHFNVRPSNTEPLLRLNLESVRSVIDMEYHRDEVLELIRSGRG